MKRGIWGTDFWTNHLRAVILVGNPGVYRWETRKIIRSRMLEAQTKPASFLGVFARVTGLSIEDHRGEKDSGDEGKKVTHHIPVTHRRLKTEEPRDPAVWD